MCQFYKIQAHVIDEVTGISDGKFEIIKVYPIFNYGKVRFIQSEKVANRIVKSKKYAIKLF